MLGLGLIGTSGFLLIKRFFHKESIITPLTSAEKAIVQSRVLKLSGREFEIFNAKIYELLGYKTILTPASNDGGKDIVIRKNGEKVFVECKHTDSKNIGRPVAQKLCGAMVANNISKGLIITLNGAHKNCTDYCNKIKGKKVKIDSIEVIDLLDLLETCSEIDAEEIFKILKLNRNDFISKHSIK